MLSSETVPRLMAIVEANDARSEDNVYATENAISTVGKILLNFYLGPLPVNVPGDPTSVGVSGIPPPRTALIRATSDARMLQLLASCALPPEQLLARWLSWLPTSADDEEVDHVYGLLCGLIETCAFIVALFSSFLLFFFETILLTNLFTI